jgi:hypothetical protein
MSAPQEDHLAQAVRTDTLAKFQAFRQVFLLLVALLVFFFFGDDLFRESCLLLVDLTLCCSSWVAQNKPQRFTFSYATGGTPTLTSGPQVWRCTAEVYYRRHSALASA